ncbi:MAG: hypothetical protein JWP97_2174 [Labilithrix sp.]|nr:hypothetical protein [Labilithrix sp.]
MTFRLLVLVVGVGLLGCGREEAEKGQRENQRRESALTSANVLRIQATAYRAEHNNACPRPSDLGKDKLDPWGHPFKITCSTDTNVGSNTVISFGPDGAQGTADDVISLSQ